MRKVIYGGACSLDGYLARDDGSVDWLLFGNETSELMKNSWARFDTMLMGRKTYEVALASLPKRSKKTKNPYGMDSYVFSTTMEATEDSGIEIVSEDAGGFVESLKRAKGRNICLMGGGILAKSLFEAGVIDEVGFNIHPLLLGTGIPTFHRMNVEVRLERKTCKPLKNGCVFVEYKVIR